MTASDSNDATRGRTDGLDRRQYLARKLSRELGMMVFIFVAVGLEANARALAYLAAVDLLLLALSWLRHGRQWDGEHAVPQKSVLLDHPLSV
jgi:hypothetical protein